MLVCAWWVAKIFVAYEILPTLLTFPSSNITNFLANMGLKNL
jgi:hypothetical protein